MKAKKSFGQHFLKEESISQRIANSLRQLEQYHQILEVGPGMGMLTKYLLQIPNHQLSVVEADTDMVDYLKVHYPQLLGHIISDDFLKVDLESFYKGEQFAIIGNFPYNISSQIMIKAVDNRDSAGDLLSFEIRAEDNIDLGAGRAELIYFTESGNKIKADTYTFEPGLGAIRVFNLEYLLPTTLTRGDYAFFVRVFDAYGNYVDTSSKLVQLN